MKPKEDYDKLYIRKKAVLTSCPGYHKKLTKVKKAGTKEIKFVCWNVGECSLAIDLTRTPSWEIVSDTT
jgi:hypothetical protein